MFGYNGVASCNTAVPLTINSHSFCYMYYQFCLQFSHLQLHLKFIKESNVKPLLQYRTLTHANNMYLNVAKWVSIVECSKKHDKHKQNITSVDMFMVYLLTIPT
jgi:hypothetical protein